MWNEIVVFVEDRDAASQFADIVSRLSPTEVERGGQHIVIDGQPIELYFHEPTWDSYSEVEQGEIRQFLPNAIPLLILFFDKAPLLTLLRRVLEEARGYEIYVDNERAGSLKLVRAEEFIDELKSGQG